jgi:hypothetical protein
VSALDIVLVVVAVLVVLTVVLGRRKPSPRPRRGDPVQRRREEREPL